MKEQQIQSKIVKYLEKQGAYVVKVVAATKKGVPDLLVCYKGVFVGVEVKVPEKKKNTTKLQDLNLQKIQAASGFSCVAWSNEQIEDVLDLIDKI
jgi:Holliday junction resolvase